MPLEEVPIFGTSRIIGFLQKWGADGFYGDRPPDGVATARPGSPLGLTTVWRTAPGSIASR